MKKRLIIVALAYRSVSVAEIARRADVGTGVVHTAISAFEADGYQGLSFGEATVTPPLRDDYDMGRLRKIAAELVDDEPGARRMEALALLYDGVTMAEAARTIGGLPAISYLVERFNRFGHGIAESFKAHLQAPKAPSPRPKPKISAAEKPVSMREDYDPWKLLKYRKELSVSAQVRFDAVIQSYCGVAPRHIAERSGHTSFAVTRWLDLFNELGVDWLMAMEPSERLQKKATRAEMRAAGQEAMQKARLRAEREEQAVRMRAAMKEERAFTKALVKARENAVEPLVTMPTSWNAKRMLKAVYRAIDGGHRHKLEILYNIYLTSANIRRVCTRLNIAEDEVRQAADLFVTNGISMGRPDWEAGMLPEDHDEVALTRAWRSPEPLRTYAQIVRGLYNGKHPSGVRTMFAISDIELQTIITTFRKEGVDGLTGDPLNVGRHSKPPAVVHHAPKQPKAPAPEPQVAVAEKPVVRISATSRVRQGVPRKASAGARLRSYTLVARPPHDMVLAAIILHEEGKSAASAARKLGVNPGGMDGWLKAYRSKGARAFLPAEKIMLHPLVVREGSKQIKELTWGIEDGVMERRLLIVADSIDGDDIITICERHSATYQEAVECVAAYSADGVAGLGIDTVYRKSYRPGRPAKTDTVSMVNALPVVEVKPPKAPEQRTFKPLPRPEYTPPPQVRMVVKAAPASKPKPDPAEAMFGGKHAHRLDAVRAFNLERNIRAVAAKHNVSTGTLEKWIVAYVTTGQAEKDRAKK
jgi:transposase